MGDTFSEADRVQLRRVLGFAAIFRQADPRLENAILAVQATADGGTRPDDSTVTAIKSYVTQIQTIETQLQKLWSMAMATAAGSARLDVYRGMIQLRSEGYRYVGYIADALATKPFRNIFLSAPTQTRGEDDFERFSRWDGGRSWR